jgi:hypothetical protein
MIDDSRTLWFSLCAKGVFGVLKWRHEESSLCITTKSSQLGLGRVTFATRERVVVFGESA